MNISIIGYGNMGREVERAAKAKGIAIQSIIDTTSNDATHREINEDSMKNVDVCIDFTAADSVISNIMRASKFKKDIVVGTTGWNERLGEARSIIKKSGSGLIHASNFSVGVNAFYMILENSARIMNKLDSYDIFGYELHHKKKSDSPSGTAKSICDILINNIKRKNKIVFDKIDGKIKPNELHFASVRSGFIPGTHVVGFDSEADTIELKHTARSRQGFAVGAIIAAEWIKGRKGFYGIGDMMGSIMNK